MASRERSPGAPPGIMRRADMQLPLLNTLARHPDVVRWWDECRALLSQWRVAKDFDRTVMLLQAMDQNARRWLEDNHNITSEGTIKVPDKTNIAAAGQPINYLTNEKVRVAQTMRQYPVSEALYALVKAQWPTGFNEVEALAQLGKQRLKDFHISKERDSGYCTFGQSESQGVGNSK